MPYDPMLAGLALVLGLIVGSFLNVVIYRFPKILEARWNRECREHLGLPEPDDQESFSLAFPASHCPHCGTPIKPWHNIPVLGYFILKGKCYACHEKISLRYPLVEALTGFLTAFTVWSFGLNVAGILAVILLWSLVALTFIDFDYHLLPDVIVLPVLWLGLLANTQVIYNDLNSVVIGTAAGYLSLWLVFHFFRLLTGKEGMGYGDFKLLALFGAWLGWQVLPQIIIISSLIGATTGIVLILLRRHQKGNHIPFGPYLALAGIIALFWGEKINNWYLGFSGLA
jgi:leader peptidase (prepilin peptidase)/N-methyltransferase